MDGEGDGAIEQASEAEECVSCFGFVIFDFFILVLLCMLLSIWWIYVHAE
jgi:hypothetical protein